MSWTQKPWKVTRVPPEYCEEFFAVGIDETHVIATVNAIQFPEAQANARLIAAAPQMYEALAMVRRWSEMYKRGLPAWERGLVEVALKDADGGTK